MICPKFGKNSRGVEKCMTRDGKCQEMHTDRTCGIKPETTKIMKHGDGMWRWYEKGQIVPLCPHCTHKCPNLREDNPVCAYDAFDRIKPAKREGEE